MTLGYESNSSIGQDLYYRPSGKVTQTGLLFAGVVGLVAAWLLSIAYAYIVLYLPFVYINALASAAFGGAIGFIAVKLARIGKIRSTPAILMLALILTIVGYYCCWSYWLSGVLHRYIKEPIALRATDLLGSPSDTWKLMQLINESGTWSVGKSSRENVSGIALSIVWVIEAGIIFVCSFLAAKVLAGAEMFCERCNRWCSGVRQIRRIVPADPGEARRRLEAHDWSYLDTLPLDPDGSSRWWALKLENCPQCRELHALTLDVNEITIDKEGKTTTNTRPIVTRLLIAAEEAQYLTAPPAPVAPAAGEEAPASEDDQSDEPAST